MITFLGDVALLNNTLKSEYHIDGDYIPNFEYVIKRENDLLKPCVNKINLSSSFFNLEKVFGKKPVGVCVANNHMLDYEKEGYDNTVSCLNKDGVQTIGEVPFWYSPETCVLAFSMIPGNCVSSTLFGFDKNIAKQKIELAKTEGATSIIVIMHWGIENSFLPNKSQIEIGRWLIDNGVNLVIGNHPHCIQPVEIYKNCYIFYSLGNCIFPSFSVKSHHDKNGIPKRTYRFNWRRWNNKGLAVIFDEKKNTVNRIDITKFVNNRLKCYKKGIPLNYLNPRRPSIFYRIQYVIRKYWLFVVSNSFVDGKLFDFNAIKQEFVK